MSSFHITFKSIVGNISRVLHVLIVAAFLLAQLGVMNAYGQEATVQTESLKNFDNPNVFTLPTFEHPDPRMGQRADISNSLLQEIDAQLQCINANCSDSGPGITLNEHFSGAVFDSNFTFIVVCGASYPGCTKKNIYYHAKMHYEWSSRFDNRNVTTYLHAASPSLAGTGFPGYAASGNLSNIYCGESSDQRGECDLETWGVLPANKIYEGELSPPTKGHFYVKGGSHNGSLGVGDTVAIELTVDISLEPYSIEFNSIPQNAQTCAQNNVADPVNTYTGIFTYPVDDFGFSTSAGPLTFRRIYNSSKAPFSLTLGHGWTHNHDIRLLFPTDPEGTPGFVTLKHPGGYEMRFWDIGDGIYQPYAGVTGSLVKDSGTPVSYTYTDQDSNVFVFDETGRIQTLTNPTGQAFAYTYNPDGTLAHVSADNDSRYLDFSYNPDGTLASVSDHTGRSVSFAYDAGGDLSGATDVIGGIWTYTYQEHLLATVNDPNGAVKVRNEYYLPSFINFNEYAVTAYGVTSNSNTVTLEDSGTTIRIVGDGYEKIEYPYVITPNTMLEFDFRSTSEGVAHGIGMDVDNDFDDGRFFQLYGPGKTNVITLYNDYTDYAPVWRHHKINIGNFYVGEMLYLFLGNEAGINPDTDSYFANIRIYEEGDDLSNRIHRQYDGEGKLVVELAYNPDGTTTVTDALGNAQVDSYNEQGELVSGTNCAGEVATNTYDHNFKPTIVTNAAGKTLSLTWSADGANLLTKIDPEGNRTDYTYDSSNNLISVIDPKGYLTTYTYAGKLLTGSEDPFGGITSYTYTLEGYLESVADPMGRTTSYTYDAHGQRTSMTDPGGNAWTYSYDDLGNLIETTDPQGRVTRNEYNAAGKLVKATRNYDPARPQNDENVYNIVTEYLYDARGNQVAVTDTFNRTTSYVYDDAGRLIQTTDTAGNVSTNTYDELGRLVSTTNALLQTTQYEYDLTGRLIRTINPLGISSPATAFDVVANTSTVTDLGGNASIFFYDGLERVYKVVDPFGNYTLTTYDENGNVVSRTDKLNRVTTYEYDALNRLTRTTDPNGGVTETFYDSAGNRTATVDPLSNTTTYTYDNIGRLIATTDPLGRITQTIYDQFGRRHATIDAAGNQTTYTYDQLDRVIAVTDPAGNTTYTSYDALGNVTSRTDANGNITTMAYDILGRLATTTDAVGNVTTNSYDAGGNLVAVTDPLGNTTTYTYDALNRRIAVTDPLGNTSQTVYDPLGNVSDTVDANGIVTHYEFDALNRQVAVVYNYRPGIQPNADTNVRYEFGYNAVGNRISVTDPLDHVTAYSYDASNRVTQKVDPLGNTWAYTYDLAGRQISATDAKNQTTSYSYDAAGQLTGIDYPGTDPDITFTYNVLGQRLSMTDGLGTTTWDYDTLNRLETVTDPFAQTVGYAYDPVGNRTGLTHPDGKGVSYEYDPLNRLANVTDWTSQATGYAYDAAGNAINITRPNGVSSDYAYDAAGRLIQLHHDQGLTQLAGYTYAYDAVGNVTQAVEDVVQPGQPTPTPTSTDTPLPTSTATQTPIPSPTATSTPVPELIFADDFESGNFAAWDASVRDSGDLAVRAAAAHSGGWGMKALIDDQVSIYAQDDLVSPLSRYRARFYFDPNSLTMNTGSSHNIFSGNNANGVRLFNVLLGYNGSSYWIKFNLRKDDNTFVSSSNYTISNAWHSIEIEWKKSGVDTNNGYFKLWIDGTLKQNLSGVDNDSRTLGSTLLGAVGAIEATTSGAMFFDDFESHRTTYIGPLAAAPGPVKAASASEQPVAAAQKIPAYKKGLLSPLALSQADLALQQSSLLTIDYAYDALYRLTSTAYSDGRSFGYTYDAAGNALEMQQNLGPGMVTTTYTYNVANELVTALKDGTTWQYTYDPNGSLTEVLPYGNPASGAQRYTYNAAGYLTQVEAHDGADWTAQAEMAYNGLGERLTMNASGLTTQYVLDGSQLLSANAGGDATFYLYGLGPVAEHSASWSYPLSDGTSTPRQLADALGNVTFSARYTPWGGTLETYGTGNFSFGYFGGIMDAATGLIYVGNGQYYDPATGRFLTRGNSGSANPYLPWDATGALLGPLGLLALYNGRRKKGSKWGTWLVVVLVVVGVGMTLSACGPSGGGAPAQVETPPGTGNPGGPASDPGNPLSPTGTPVAPPAPPCLPHELMRAWSRPLMPTLPTAIPPTGTPTPTPSSPYFANGRYDRQAAVQFALKYKDKTVFAGDYQIDPENDCTNFVSYALQAGGLLPTGEWYSGGTKWIRSAELHDYLPSVGFTMSPLFENTDNYQDNNDPRKQDNYLRLRENTDDMISRNGTVRMKWVDFMSTLQNVQPGDLVFYHDNRHASWSHVAIVTEAWADPTQLLWDTAGIQEPLIVDHDGPPDVPPEKLPRSIGDTDNDLIMKVQILFAP